MYASSKIDVFDVALGRAKVATKTFRKRRVGRTPATALAVLGYSFSVYNTTSQLASQPKIKQHKKVMHAKAFVTQSRRGAVADMFERSQAPQKILEYNVLECCV